MIKGGKKKEKKEKKGKRGENREKINKGKNYDKIGYLGGGGGTFSSNRYGTYIKKSNFEGGKNMYDFWGKYKPLIIKYKMFKSIK